MLIKRETRGELLKQRVFEASVTWGLDIYQCPVSRGRPRLPTPLSKKRGSYPDCRTDSAPIVYMGIPKDMLMSRSPSQQAQTDVYDKH